MENKSAEQAVKEVYPDAICEWYISQEGVLQYFIFEDLSTKKPHLNSPICETEEQAWQSALEKITNDKTKPMADNKETPKDIRERSQIEYPLSSEDMSSAATISYNRRMLDLQVANIKGAITERELHTLVFAEWCSMTGWRFYKSVRVASGGIKSLWIKEGQEKTTEHLFQLFLTTKNNQQ